MTFPASSVVPSVPHWNTSVYPEMAMFVVPGLSTVQKWRMRSPATIPEGRLREVPVPRVIPTVVLVDATDG